MIPPNNNITIVVPARLESSRLPNKMAQDIGGMPMLVRVLHQSAKTQMPVVAAVDAKPLQQMVEAAGFRAILTGDHSSGSSRLAEAAQKMELNDDAIIVNVQGDEPFIEPHIIQSVAYRLLERDDCVCATACRPIKDITEYNDPAAVKVVCDINQNASYFSRAAIPFNRESQPKNLPDNAYLHLGIYAYRVKYLRRYIQLPTAPTERIEKLEQLRILWHGDKISVVTVESNSFGIDTKEDLIKAQQLINATAKE